MTTKHTPGPWRYKPWSAREGYIVATTDKQKEALVAGTMLKEDAEFVIALVNAAIAKATGEDA